MKFFKVRIKAVLGIICAVTAVAGVTLLDTADEVQAVLSDFHVVIDAGHGGRDGGAVSADSKTRESDINLKIAQNLAKELTVRGVGVTMTRTNHESLASPFAGNRKQDDMNKRRLVIEKAAPDLVVSIHLNNFASDRSVRGLQVFHVKDSTEGKRYADAVQAEFNRANPLNHRNAAVGDYYILNCSSFTSILVECGFLSNSDDLKLLKTTEYQRVLAYEIACAIVKTAEIMPAER